MRIALIMSLICLSGCGKSDIDKCVEAGMRGFDAECAAKPFEDSRCTAPGGRSNEEFAYRMYCLKAASGKS